MARRVKITRKSIKEPDQFLSTSEKMLIFCSEHKSKLIGGALAAVLIFTGLVGFRYYQNVNTQKMEALLFEMQEIKSKADPKEPGKSTSQMNEVLERFGEGSQKQRARLLLANTYFQNNQFDQAIPVYSEVVEKSRPGEIHRILARVALAYAHEGKKEYSKAIEILKSVLEEKSDYPLFEIYLSLARCYELNQDSKNALLILREMKVKFPSHPQINLIEGRIKKLETRV